MKILVLGLCLAVGASVGVLVTVPMRHVSATTQQIEAANNPNSCHTTTTLWSTCTLSVTWPTAFPDTSYSVVCTPQNGETSSDEPYGGSFMVYAYPPDKTTTGASMIIENLSNSSYPDQYAYLNGIDCIGVHN